MRINTKFNLVDIADEHLIVPVGEEAVSFNGVVAISEPASFLFKKMLQPTSKDELVKLLTQEYDVEPSVAEKDIDIFLENLYELGIVIE